MSLKPEVYHAAVAVYRRWLYMPNTTNLEFVWAVCAANRLDGLPVWGGLIGPPGAGKTAIIQSLDDRDPATRKENRFFLRSTLTERTLLSGLPAKDAVGGVEPSLLPKLDGKILVVKDFGTILSKRAELRAAIFGQLRDCFDGGASGSYGTGESKFFEAKFGLILAVTIDIEDAWSKEQSLGERILYCREDLTDEQRELMADKATEHVEQNKERVEALRRAAFSVTSLPSIPGIKAPEPDRKRVVALGTFVAAARTQIKRSGKHGDFKRAPHNEVGTRLAQQYLLLGKGWCSMWQTDQWPPECTQFLQRVAPGSIPSNRWKLLKAIWHMGKPTVTDTLAKATGLPNNTVTLTCQELEGVGLIEHGRVGNAFTWEFSVSGRRQVERSGLAPVLESTQ